MRDNNLLKSEEEKMLREKFNGKSVLVVEDDSISGHVICKMLSKYFNVDTVETAEACFNKIVEKEYSLIFTDINLGYGISGLDVVKRIRNINGYKETPIIAITAYAMKGDKEGMLEAGCTDYLSKPFSKDKMVNLLKQIKLQN